LFTFAKNLIVMSIFFIFVVAVAMFSCNDEPDRIHREFEVTDSATFVTGVNFAWKWESVGNSGKAKAEFSVDNTTVIKDGTATAYSIKNTGGFISDVFTYKDGKPDTQNGLRTWVIKYSGNARSIKIDWEATVIGGSAGQTATVETVFQVYAIIPDNVIPSNFNALNPDFDWRAAGRWPVVSNNIRPQIGIDTLFLGMGHSAEKIIEERENARERMLARYYTSEAFLESGVHDMEGSDEYYFPVLERIIGIPTTPVARYYMQLYTRVTSNDANSNVTYKIDAGHLGITFVY